MSELESNIFHKQLCIECQNRKPTSTELNDPSEENLIKMDSFLKRNEVYSCFLLPPD